MKQFITLLLLSCLFVACKKDDEPAGPVTPTNPYYFKFKLDGVSYDFRSGLAQYISSDDYEAGGYQMQDGQIYPSIGLSFRFDTTVSEAQLLALAGKTIPFNNTNPRPRITFDESINANTQWSIDTSNTAFNVKISSITYVKKDTSIFNIVDVYAIKGTCTAVVDDFGSGAVRTISEGAFNFLISRVKR